MHRKRPQVLGVGLNPSESSRPGLRNNFVTRAPKALVRMARDNNSIGASSQGQETVRTALRPPAGHGATAGTF